MCDEELEIIANNCVNIFTVEGFLTSDVKLSSCETKRVRKATFYLRNPNKTKEGVFFNDIYIIVYGKKAEMCNRNLSKGDFCTISGTLCLWSRNKEDGSSNPGATVIASDVFWNKKHKVGNT